MASSTPAWLRERVNDPYGTPNRHEFWSTVEFERIGDWKVFERGGVWYAYDMRYNCFWHFASRAEAVARVEGGHVDVWA